MEIQTLHVVDTEYSADSVEWCLHPRYLGYFACGTYELDSSIENSSSQAPCRRKGRIYLFKYEIKENILIEKYRIETAAILDMKWLNYHSEEFPILATANALGEIHIYNMEENKFVLKHSLELNSNTNESLLTLSLEWSPNVESELGNYKLIATDSKGNISLIIYNGVQLKKIKTVSAHNFEAWTCTFDKWNENCIFTGGDDTTLNLFDIRDSQMIKMNTNNSHIAGVTAMLSHPKMKNILLTGSYDDRLRVFDTRNFKKCITELNLEGGIWRTRADPLTKNQNLILCACMYKNFSIVKLLDTSYDMLLEAVYEEHKSICYGADWCTDSKNYPDKLIMGTCSFYDHKLCISKVVAATKE